MPFTPSKNIELKAAVSAWVNGRSEANATYGPIASWDTSLITDMSHLFCGYEYGGTSSFWADYYSDCIPAKRNFNDDISSWDTSAVTRMESMFRHSRSFNQDINAWDVAAVTGDSDFHGFYQMFQGATAFNQELCWSTGTANTENMFEDSLGVLNGTCSPSPAPTVTSSPTVTANPTAKPTPTPRPTNPFPVPAPTPLPTQLIESKKGTALAVGVPLILVMLLCCIRKYFQFLKKRAASRAAEPGKSVADLNLPDGVLEMAVSEGEEPQKQEEGKGPEPTETLELSGRTI